MRPSLFLFAIFTMTGCGPSARELREQTISTLNFEADRWEGGKEFATTATDSYGRPVVFTIEKTTLNYKLEVRSVGPDGLAKNSDDLVVHRSKRHGESSITEEATKATEAISGAAASGAIQGIKKGLGQGEKKK